jgi:hypothetical protein
MKTPRLLPPGASLALFLALACNAAAAEAGPQGQPPPQKGTIERQNNMKEALATPLEDVNVRKVPIPEVLKKAVVRPYDLTGLTSCAGVANEMRMLDTALGPDFDVPPTPAETSRLDQAKGGAATVTRLGAQMLMPFRGVVRQLSGANAYQREVYEAIEAGSARRGFLKGIGMRMNCAPPAAPYGFRPPVVTRQPARTAPPRTPPPAPARRR